MHCLGWRVVDIPSMGSATYSDINLLAADTGAQIAIALSRPGTIIGFTEFIKAGGGNYTTTSNTLVAVDSTLGLLTFACPASGTVLLEANFTVEGSAVAAPQVGWLNNSGGAQVGEVRAINYSTAVVLPNCTRIRITGLVPFQSYTLQLAWLVNAGTMTLTGGSSTANSILLYAMTTP